MKENGAYLKGRAVAKKQTKSGGFMISYSTDDSIWSVFYRADQVSQIPEMLVDGHIRVSVQQNGFITAI